MTVKDGYWVTFSKDEVDLILAGEIDKVRVRNEDVLRDPCFLEALEKANKESDNWLQMSYKDGKWTWMWTEQL